MLLENYCMRLHLPPCNPSTEALAAIIEFEDDLAEPLPHINAELGPGVFDRDQHTLRLNHEGRAIVFHRHKIAISKLKDEAEAESVFRAIRGQVRSIAERRDKIAASYHSLGDVSTLDVYKLLPGTNCRECGLPSCFAFAAALTRGQADIERCRPLSAQEHAQQRAELEALLGLSRKIRSG